MTTPSASTAALETRTLADIATHLPGATAVFRKHRLDFCCGGNVALADAAAKRGLPRAELVAELQALRPGPMKVESADTAMLIDTILTRYHETHRRELPELIRLARRVEAVHKAHPDVPKGLAGALDELHEALEAHMAKEEGILFPLMLEGAPMVVHPIAVMRVEHDEHGERIRAIEALIRSGQWPEGACPTWRALYSGVRKLIDDLMEHIHLENNVLFPRFVRG